MISDANSTCRTACCSLVFALGRLAIPGLAQPEPAGPLSTADFLNWMIDLDRLARPPNGEKTGMFSSYDRKSRIDESGKYVDWEANADWGQFLRTEPDGWSVMAEMSGPGVISRIWSANPQGTIRFVLDGETVIEAPFENLFNGKLAPFAEPLCYMNPHNGGKNCYFPIGYARSCQVSVKDSKSYYQINYISLRPGTQAERFTPELNEAARAALSEVSMAWAEGMSESQLFRRGRAHPVVAAPDNETIGKGEKFELSDGGAGTIRTLAIALTDRVAARRELYGLHQCILRIWFDGRKEPHVEAPLVDFFGSGFELEDYTSLALGTAKSSEMPMISKRAGDSRVLYCNFPMPYSNGFRVEVENLSMKKLGLILLAYVENTPPAADSLRFHARFRKMDPCTVFDYPVLETTGPGRIVGCLLNVDCPRQGWWGEGDDKVWIDGEKFPSYFGTGTEDYLGDAWGLRHHIRPVEGVTRTGAYGKNSAYRWHVLDSINFEKSVRFTIENWQDRMLKDTYFSTVAYWYGPAESKHDFKPIKPVDVTPPGLRIPNAVEIEDNIGGEKWGTEVKQKYAGGDELSGEAAARITLTEPVRINLPSKDERYVELSLRVQPGQPFETIEVAAPDATPVGTAKYEKEANGIYKLGNLWLRPGDNLLNVTCTKSAVLDCWIVQRIAKASPYAIEAEGLKVTGSNDANETVQELDKSRFSGGAHLWARPTQAGAWLEFELPVPKAGKYKLGIVYTTSFDYGIVQTSLNGRKVAEPFDTFGNLQPGPVRPLGVLDLPAGPARLKAEVIGKADKSPGYFFGIDCVLLEPVNP